VSGVVTWITYAPVKGLGLVSVDDVELEEAGVRGNRRFHLIGDDGRLVNGKFAGQLVQIRASAHPDGRSLSLELPDGSSVAGEVETGEAVVTSFYGQPVGGHLVGGEFAEAISAFAGRPLRLVRVDETGTGNDRGPEGSVSIVSQGALDLLAREAGVEGVDGRRFRMLFGLDGVAAHVEDAWVGRRVAVGSAVVTVRGLVGRCAVTTQNPETGVKDLDTLRTIRRYRPEVEGEEPLPIGVWGGVEQPGRVRVGDTVEPL
jgi:uncharacterized protein YcbX